jgi:hypothetical protein
MLYDLQGQEKGHVVIVTGAILEPQGCVCRLGEPSPVITFSYSSKLAPLCTATPEATRFEGVFRLASKPFRVVSRRVGSYGHDGRGKKWKREEVCGSQFLRPGCKH